MIMNLFVMGKAQIRKGLVQLSGWNWSELPSAIIISHSWTPQLKTPGPIHQQLKGLVNGHKLKNW